MPFIGNQPALAFTSFAKQDFTTSATTSYTLDNPVANANELALFINFVRQEPTTAYTASGTSLTLTSATSASDDMYCVFLGKAVQTVNPPVGSVGTAQISSSAKSTNLLYPAFETSTSSQSISNTTVTKITAGTETFDTDSCYDNATNYRFTPTTAGKYFVYTQAFFEEIANSNRLYNPTIRIRKNGSDITNGVLSFISNNATYSTAQPITFNCILDMNGSSDYVEAFGYVQVSSGTPVIKNARFGAYRIGV